ncbi:CASP-like protein 5A1 isoform X1 [Tripterygium wilfordii]|uniref:CASP-like protein n=1 Tax=Tripterygium wilfordii TaxID=458696 RepID=A0A7J7CTZ6_TRIWF|nr:CASP-like protein 5A2 [Tripterygium wilfordii]KAF5737551.1 CASP-like protein 5A1 isoform X1 [Tripterygium wilfordii]
MNASQPAVHPVEAPPLREGAMNNEPPRMRMKDTQGMPGTVGGLGLRLSQFVFSLVSLCVMVSTPDFNSVTAFNHLVVAVSLQNVWSLFLAILDIYALLVRRSLRNYLITRVFAIGDGITSTLTFATASASAGITVLVANDLNKCAGNHCASFESATAMAFLSWMVSLPSFLLNFWSLASQ